MHHHIAKEVSSYRPEIESSPAGTSLTITGQYPPVKNKICRVVGIAAALPTILFGPSNRTRRLRYLTRLWTRSWADPFFISQYESYCRGLFARVRALLHTTEGTDLRQGQCGFCTGEHAGRPSTRAGSPAASPIVSVLAKRHDAQSLVRDLG
jgi:hypothetical protein